MCKELDEFKSVVSCLGKKKTADEIKQLMKKLVDSTSKRLKKNKDMVKRLNSLYEVSGLDELKSVEDFVKHSVSKNGMEDSVEKLASRINKEFNQFIGKLLSQMREI